MTELGIADRVVETNAEAVEGRRSRDPLHPGRRLRRGRAGDRAASQAGRDRLRRRLGQGRGASATWRRICPPACISCPAHPVAGTEHSGPDSGFAELFVNRWCILTPPDGTDPAAVDKLRAFWTALGAKVEIMTPEHHDLVLAITSHLPHLIAYTIVGTAADLEDVTQSEVMKFSAGGFRDFTRIAASDPTMWRDVFLTNKDAVLEMLGRFNEDLSKLTRAIRRGDGDALFEHFTRTRAIRRGIVEIGQDSAAPDFGRAARAACDEDDAENRRIQNSGGVWPTFNGPMKTAPSTNRSGKARAFLPSSVASCPSALMPAATPTLAFSRTALPSPESPGPARRTAC